LDAIALGLAVYPLAEKTVAMNTSPDTISALVTFSPFTVIDFAVLPGISSFAISFSVGVLSLEHIAVTK
jgi:hypothetical protein